LTKRISGTPAAVINTPYIQKQGLELNPIEALLLKIPQTKKYMKMLKAFVGSQLLKKAATRTTWKEVWSAGQGVGLIDKILPCEEIIQKLVEEYYSSCNKLFKQSRQEETLSK
ncbi:MAG: hypothetical protein ABI041_08025, partial [Bdellovibrionia bacterium]